MPNASLTIDGTEVIKKENGEVYLNNTNFVPSNPFTFRNKIINGDMRIDQRQLGTQTNPNGLTVDRWKGQNNLATAAYTIEQTAEAPEGFDYSLLLTCTNNTALDTNNFVYISTRIETQDLKKLGFWTSTSTNKITLSFYVKANYTGAHSVSIALYDNTLAQVTTIHQSFTINSANTWEKKTITWPVATGNYSIPNDTDVGITLGFTIAAHSGRYLNSNIPESSWTTIETRGAILPSDGGKNFCDTVGNTFQITGVQMEEGPVATPFEHRPYGLELSLCQRYYTGKIAVAASGYATGAGQTARCAAPVVFPVSVRTTDWNLSYIATTAGNVTAAPVENDKFLNGFNSTWTSLGSSSTWWWGSITIDAEM